MMKRLFLLILSLAALASPAWTGGLLIGSGVVVNDSCSGDFSSGINESFEKGTGQFCTTDWTLSVADSGVITTYDTTEANCGTHAMKIVLDSDNTGANRAVADLGSNLSTVYVRFYLYVSDLAYYSVNDFLYAADTSDLSGGYAARINLLRSDGNPWIRFDDSIEKIQINFSTWYRVEVKIVGNGGQSETKAWVKNGSSWDAILTTESDYILDLYNLTNSGENTNYLIFTDNTDSPNPGSVIIDDVQVSTTGYIGGVTCP